MDEKDKNAQIEATEQALKKLYELEKLNESGHLRYVTAFDEWMNWNYMKACGCQHASLNELDVIMQVRFEHSTHTHKFEVRRDPCTGFIIVLNHLTERWSWTIYREKAEKRSEEGRYLCSEAALAQRGGEKNG